MWCRQRAKPARLGSVDDAVVGDRTQVPKLGGTNGQSLAGFLHLDRLQNQQATGGKQQVENRFEMVKPGTRLEEWEPYGRRNSLTRL